MKNYAAINHNLTQHKFGYTTVEHCKIWLVLEQINHPSTSYCPANKRNKDTIKLDYPHIYKVKMHQANAQHPVPIPIL